MKVLLRIGFYQESSIKNLEYPEYLALSNATSLSGDIAENPSCV